MARCNGTLMQSLGIQIIAVTEESVVGTMPVDKRTHQPFGCLHGGASVALAETLGSIAANLTLPEHLMAMGLEINANHIKAVCSGIVTGYTRPLHLGRRTQVWDIQIVNERQQRVCVCRLTVMVSKNAKIDL